MGKIHLWTLPDAEFNAVIGVSVFTHLPNRLQDIWLTELKRVTKPGGVLILSVHNQEFAKNRLSAAQFADLEANGTHYLVHATGKAKLDGLYCGLLAQALRGGFPIDVRHASAWKTREVFHESSCSTESGLSGR